VTGLGEVLETVRRSQGLTQERLASEVGITQAALSRYENNLRDPDDQALAAVAEALGVTVGFLRHAGRARAGMALDAHMRRRATAPPAVWRRLEAQLNVYRWHASHLFEEVSIRAEHRVPSFDPLDVPPQDAARLVRAQWRMPAGPVRGLVEWLESAGCLLILEDFGTSRVDGLSQWIGDHPVILYNDLAATDRVRLMLAHELGHLVLHSAIDGSDDVEAEASLFAAEFLMPADVIRPALRNIKIGRLLDLKREWGVSMHALVERAVQLDLLSRSQRASMYKMFSAKGWRTREPGSTDLAPERPELVQEILRTMLGRGLSNHEVADIAGFSGAENNDFLRPAGLRAV
jgi:Zn-dependent peptidase ImmA (M78 family)/DNA-binding XRE family transcriptional regulator